MNFVFRLILTNGTIITFGIILIIILISIEMSSTLENL